MPSFVSSQFFLSQLIALKLHSIRGNQGLKIGTAFQGDAAVTP